MKTESPAGNDAEFDWSTAYPGEQILLPHGVKMNVYPVGVPHLNKFKAQTRELIGKLLVELGGDPDPGSQKVRIGKALVPFLSGPGFDLLSACCRPSLAGAPLPVIPLAAEACVRQTFPEGCLRPFVSAVEAMGAAATGRKVSILEISSAIWSLAATRPSVFSTRSKPDLTENLSPTEDIPSPKSSPGDMPGAQPAGEFLPI